MKQSSDDYYRELEDRLRVLVPEVEAVLSEQGARLYVEFLDAGEYGLAVETATDDLAESNAKASTTLARSLLAEADVMGLDESYRDRLQRLAAASA